MKVVEANELKKNYGKKEVLTNVSLSIEGEKIIGLVGRNGEGKSTLLKLISGLIAKDSGELFTFGEEPFDHLFVSANTIYIHPELIFPSGFTVEQICKTAQEFYPFWNQIIATELIKYFGISLKSIPSKLSTGERQAFFTIFGLATRSALTILDEPVNGLDDAKRKDIYRVILKDYMAEPRTMILSSHLVDEMEHLLEEIVILNDGEIVEHCTIEELTNKYKWQHGAAETLVDGIGPIEQNALEGAKRIVGYSGQNNTQMATVKEIYLAVTSNEDGGIDGIYNKTK
ncbi:ABC transporter [Kurthia zopfii]|uniref:ABC-2 type transport system ATP-binding protein n=1 Tax=Kurthia zopfii TaxID=1650 RepID=A0A8B4Q5C7_9BACL|nr:ABC transporter ATP-binding protein [Kurthia zopfii]TDR37783.1 ABC-2 type transport system ATP-binding protein [Kurthia zopfii]GEK30882.1 ABC transporter [Kurthia zopfii]STX08459.1 Lipopolysaccharide export system ATP-binding protein LptB [Kurthia zopfii]